MPPPSLPAITDTSDERLCLPSEFGRSDLSWVNARQYKSPTESPTASDLRRSIQVMAIASIHSTPSITMNYQSQSPFFDKLPPELRLMVYERLFENTKDSINLSSALSLEHGNDSKSGPGTAATHSTALLRTCQRICGESEKASDKSLQTFWEKEFVVDNRAYPDPEAYLGRIPPSYIRSIRNFTFLVSWDRRHPIRLQVPVAQGRWTIRTTCQSRFRSPLGHYLSCLIAGFVDYRFSVRLYDLTINEYPHIRRPLCTMSCWRMLYIMFFFDPPPRSLGLECRTT